MKIVLANTVGIDSGGWTIIPYPSRWTTASLGRDDAFTYYPRDLAYLSSLLKRDTSHEVKLLDGCLERLDRNAYADRIAAERPDWLVIEDSTRTFEDDAWIAAQVKARCGARVVFTGQHATACPEEASVIADLVVQGEYLLALRDWFRDGPDERRLIPFGPASLIPVDELPFPEDEDVSRHAYALRGDPICEYREIQIYTSRGCPYRCNYCVARHSYYGGPQWRARRPSDVVNEIRTLVRKYPAVEGFFFDDEIHNASVEHVKHLCREIIAAGLDGLHYEAMCAYAPFDREALELMKAAGYYKVRVGIETGSDVAAAGLQLGGKYRPERLHAFLEDARHAGLSVYGTFTIGGKGSSEVEDRKTVNLMADLVGEDLLSDCQVSICTPQPGSPYYAWARSEGVLRKGDWRAYDGGECAVVDLPGYSAAQINAMRAEALAAYDAARQQRDRTVFRPNWELAAGSLAATPRRVLTFRCVRDWQLGFLLDGIAASWGASIGVLTNAAGVDSPVLAERRGLEVFVQCGTGFLRSDKLDRAVIERMRAFAPDVVLVPTAGERLDGYANVIEIAKHAAGASRLCQVTGAGRFRDFDLR